MQELPEVPLDFAEVLIHRIMLSLISVVEREKTLENWSIDHFEEACHHSLTKEEELTVGHVLKYATKSSRG
jgi:hypothetical protein